MFLSNKSLQLKFIDYKSILKNLKLFMKKIKNINIISH